jgi:hypothetical protein
MPIELESSSTINGGQVYLRLEKELLPGTINKNSNELLRQKKTSRIGVIKNRY